MAAGHPFLGGAHGLVGAMYAPDPATGAALALMHLVAHDDDVLGAGGSLLDGGDPADPLVARERRDVLPQGKHLFVCEDGLLHIGG